MQTASIWVELEANKDVLLDERRLQETFVQCKNVGITEVVLGAKDISGCVPFPSNYAPHISTLWKEAPADYDLLAMAIPLARENGLKVMAAPDIFSEGRTGRSDIPSPGFLHPDWQSRVQILGRTGQVEIKPVTEVKPEDCVFDSIDASNTVFVNPCRVDVRAYELGILAEIARYPIDGIILDRCRYMGMSADFSPETRSAFETFIGERVERWPEDVYTLDLTCPEKYHPGPWFALWLRFRASVIQSFVAETREAIHQVSPQLSLNSYTGSWYPIYYQLGVNWASTEHHPDYPFDTASYEQTGYVQLLDRLYSGLYYPDVTIEDGQRNAVPAQWYTVEGAAQTAMEVVRGDTPVIGSLFLAQYQHSPDDFVRAMKMCIQKTDGLMLFDHCYVRDYNWWSLIQQVLG